MLLVGNMNKLTVNRIVDMGAYLESDEGEVLLPKKLLSERLRVGDAVNVFVYLDSKDRLMATNVKPFAVVGSFATLEVVDVNDYGAFLDWGMEKDLLLPYRRQLKPVEPGQIVVAKVILDDKTGRITASTKLRPYLNLADRTLSPGAEMRALFFDETEVGWLAVLNNKYLAMLRNEDAGGTLNVGEERKVFLKRILPEGQIEISLRKVGYQAVIQSRQVLLQALKRNDGFLPYTDRSSPEDIRREFDMSKKAFKKVVGTLYKEKKIILEDKGIRLV